MISYNIICFLDNDNVVEHLECWDFGGNNDNVSVWAEYIGKKINSFLDIDLNKNSGYVDWKGMVLKFNKVVNALGRGYILYITNGADNTKIFEEALDCISEGIQVYDPKGYLLFCNRFSEKIEKMNRANIVGKHLLDIYDLNEDYSTILNTIKIREPVLNRCDHFKNKNGEVIMTINSGYPLFVEDKLIGAVGLVQDRTVFERQKTTTEIFEKFLAEYEGSQTDKKSKSYYTFKYYNFDDLVGEDEGFQDTIRLARNISQSDCPVLIYGETGTGKELFAQSIHSASKRKHAEFVAINCAAIPESLIEGILFGTERGSFTGSVDRIGLFEQAEGGTLFLDEINSMNLQMQSKLLRVLQENKFRRVGGLRDIKCDIRVISSTNEEPFYSIENNKIRKDLYYRISTVTISIPPLRERKRDIDVLVKYFIDKLSRHYSKKVRGVSEEVLEAFNRYEWPGNVRELLHVIEYCFNIMSEEIIQKRHLPKYLTNDGGKSRSDTMKLKTLEQIMDQYEKEVIENALKRHGNNVTQAAEELGIMRQSLQYRIKKHGI